MMEETGCSPTSGSLRAQDLQDQVICLQKENLTLQTHATQYALKVKTLHKQLVWSQIQVAQLTAEAQTLREQLAGSQGEAATL